MCGLIHIIRKDGRSAVKPIKKQYRKQKSRGFEGFGYVAIRDNKIVSYQRALTEHEIMQKLDQEDAPEILFHHRFPTSTPNMEEQAHPILVQHNTFKHDYYVAHNGVIRNPFLRKQEHDKLEIAYSTELTPMWKTHDKRLYYADLNPKFNDSEALAVDTALVLEGQLGNIEAEGAAAVIALQVKDNVVIDRIFYRNNSNPLKFTENNHMLMFSSQGTGTDVDPIYIQRLVNNKLERHPINKFSPVSFRSSYHHTIAPAYDSRFEDDLEYGFARGDDYPVVFQKSEVPDLATDDLLKAVSDTDLWSEYYNAQEAIKSLTNGIAYIDGKVALKSEFTEEQFNNMVAGRTRLQKSLDTARVKSARADAELARRVQGRSLLTG